MDKKEEKLKKKFEEKKILTSKIEKDLNRKKITENEYWKELNRKVITSMGVSNLETKRTSFGGAAKSLIRRQLKDLNNIKNMDNRKPKFEILEENSPVEDFLDILEKNDVPEIQNEVDEAKKVLEWVKEESKIKEEKERLVLEGKMSEREYEEWYNGEFRVERKRMKNKNEYFQGRLPILYLSYSDNTSEEFKEFLLKESDSAKYYSRELNVVRGSHVLNNKLDLSTDQLHKEIENSYNFLKRFYEKRLTDEDDNTRDWKKLLAKLDVYKKNALEDLNDMYGKNFSEKSAPSKVEYSEDDEREKILKILESQKAPEELQYSVSKISDLVGAFKNAEKNEHNYDQTKKLVDGQREKVVEISKNKIEDRKLGVRMKEELIDDLQEKKVVLEREKKGNNEKIYKKYEEFAENEFVFFAEKDEITKKELFGDIKWPLEDEYLNKNITTELMEIDTARENINQLLSERKEIEQDDIRKEDWVEKKRLEQIEKEIIHHVKMINKHKKSILKDIYPVVQKKEEEGMIIDFDIRNLDRDINLIKDDQKAIEEEIKLYEAYVEEYGKDDWFEMEIGHKEDFLKKEVVPREEGSKDKEEEKSSKNPDDNSAEDSKDPLEDTGEEKNKDALLREIAENIKNAIPLTIKQHKLYTENMAAIISLLESSETEMDTEKEAGEEEQIKDVIQKMTSDQALNTEEKQFILTHSKEVLSAVEERGNKDLTRSVKEYIFMAGDGLDSDEEVKEAKENKNPQTESEEPQEQSAQPEIIPPKKAETESEDSRDAKKQKPGATDNDDSNSASAESKGEKKTSPQEAEPKVPKEETKEKADKKETKKTEEQTELSAKEAGSEKQEKPSAQAQSEIVPPKKTESKTETEKTSESPKNTYELELSEKKDEISSLENKISKIEKVLSSFPEGVEKIKVDIDGLGKEYSKEDLEELRDKFQGTLEYKEQDIILWKEQQEIKKNLKEINILIKSLGNDFEKKIYFTFKGERKEYARDELLDLWIDLNEEETEISRERVKLFQESQGKKTEKKNEEVKGWWGKKLWSKLNFKGFWKKPKTWLKTGLIAMVGLGLTGGSGDIQKGPKNPTSTMKSKKNNGDFKKTQTTEKHKKPRVNVSKGGSTTMTIPSRWSLDHKKIEKEKKEYKKKILNALNFHGSQENTFGSIEDNVESIISHFGALNVEDKRIILDNLWEKISLDKNSPNRKFLDTSGKTDDEIGEMSIDISDIVSKIKDDVIRLDLSHYQDYLELKSLKKQVQKASKIRYPDAGKPTMDIKQKKVDSIERKKYLKQRAEEALKNKKGAGLNSNLSTQELVEQIINGEKHPDSSKKEASDIVKDIMKDEWFAKIKTQEKSIHFTETKVLSILKKYFMEPYSPKELEEAAKKLSFSYNYDNSIIDGWELVKRLETSGVFY